VQQAQRQKGVQADMNMFNVHAEKSAGRQQKEKTSV
jgi:hypothetical protein